MDNLKCILRRLLIFISLLFISNLNADLPNFKMQILNNSGVPDDEVYIFAKGSSPNGGDSYLELDVNGTGRPKNISSSPKSIDYVYKLSLLPQGNTPNSRTITIPQMSSGRIYFSLGYPLEISKSSDPDGFKVTDHNFYKIYDKVEFSYVYLNQPFIFINPTAVDFFSVPLQIREEYKDGRLLLSGISSSRSEVFNKAESMFQTASSPSTWEALFIKNDSNQIIRMLASGKSGIPARFDANYLKNYINFIWNHYSNPENFITISASEICEHYDPWSYPNRNPDQFMLTGRVENGVFTFRNKVGEVYKIGKPSTLDALGGAGSSFNAGSSINNNNPGAIIVREISSAIVVGMLPAPNDAVMGSKAGSYLISNKDKYYDNSKNPFLQTANITNKPWFDLYGKVLHSFGHSQPIYTFAYDDALGQDGTLAFNPVSDNLKKPLTIVIGDMSGIEINSPNKDVQGFDITYVNGSNYKLIKRDGTEINLANDTGMHTINAISGDRLMLKKDSANPGYFVEHLNTRGYDDGLVINRVTPTGPVTDFAPLKTATLSPAFPDSGDNTGDDNNDTGGGDDNSGGGDTPSVEGDYVVTYSLGNIPNSIYTKVSPSGEEIRLLPGGGVNVGFNEGDILKESATRFQVSIDQLKAQAYPNGLVIHSVVKSEKPSDDDSGGGSNDDGGSTDDTDSDDDSGGGTGGGGTTDDVDPIDNDDDKEPDNGGDDIDPDNDDGGGSTDDTDSGDDNVPFNVPPAPVNPDEIESTYVGGSVIIRLPQVEDPNVVYNVRSWDNKVLAEGIRGSFVETVRKDSIKDVSNNGLVYKVSAYRLNPETGEKSPETKNVPVNFQPGDETYILKSLEVGRDSFRTQYTVNLKMLRPQTNKHGVKYDVALLSSEFFTPDSVPVIPGNEISSFFTDKVNNDTGPYVYKVKTIDINNGSVIREETVVVTKEDRRDAFEITYEHTSKPSTKAYILEKTRLASADATSIQNLIDKGTVTAYESDLLVIFLPTGGKAIDVRELADGQRYGSLLIKKVIKK